MQHHVRGDERIRKALDSALDMAIEERRIVGAVVLASLSGHLIYERAAGYADREAGTPTRPDTIFRWASLTKAVVAAATLALVEKGVVSLDDPVTRFLPDFRPQLPGGQPPVITLRHLITHTAGLTYRLLEPEDGPYHRANVSEGLDQPGLTIGENLKRIASAGLSYAPGTAWGYSVATDVLGECIARATQTALPALLAQSVTGPLEMTDSAFTVTDRNRLSQAYGDASPEPVRMGAQHRVPFQSGSISFAPDRLFNPSSYPSAGAGMNGTGADFHRFLEALRTGGAPVLERRSIDMLSTIRPGDFETFMPGWKWPLGWSVLADPAKTRTPQTPGTWRWGGVYGSSWFVDPAQELSVTIVTNTAVAGMLGPFPDSIRDAIYTSLKP